VLAVEYVAPLQFNQFPPAMPDEFPYDVFLSHSAKDKAVMRPLADGVKHSDFGFRHSDFGFSPPCLSANTSGSDWAQLESGTLRTGQRPFRDPLNKERRFLPLRLDDAPIKGSGWFCKDDDVWCQFGGPHKRIADFAWVQPSCITSSCAGHGRLRPRQWQHGRSSAM